MRDRGSYSAEGPSFVGKAMLARCRYSRGKSCLPVSGESHDSKDKVEGHSRDELRGVHPLSENLWRNGSCRFRDVVGKLTLNSGS